MKKGTLQQQTVLKLKRCDCKTTSLDFRPRAQLSTYYKKLGLFFGYSSGLTNYIRDASKGTPRLTSKMIRFGVSYQINN